jgi:prepilin signal peptidase PulO-like enzyme (type II secretory pathway)
MIIAILVVLGLCFGSFVNACVWRLHEQEELKDQIYALGSKKTSAKKLEVLKIKLAALSITRGRSMCTHCGHTLSAHDLVPVLSWIELRGKCRYCKAHIDDTPVAELATAAVFVASYVWWPLGFHAYGLLNFIVWLVILVGFMALVLYDIRWMLLPNRIVFPLIALAGITALINITVFHGGFHGVRDTVLSLTIASGLFYILYELSKGTWIGKGDVKLGLVIGFLIVNPFQAFLVLFTASLLGTLVIIPGMIAKKVTSKSHIPFGPFLILATIIVKLFGASIITWYSHKFLSY